MIKNVPIARQISDFKVYVWYITGYEVYELDDFYINKLLDYYCRDIHWMCVVRSNWSTALRSRHSQIVQEQINKMKVTKIPKKEIRIEYEQISLFKEVV